MSRWLPVQPLSWPGAASPPPVPCAPSLAAAAWARSIACSSSGRPAVRRRPEVLRSIPVAVERAIRDFAANEAGLAKGECLEQLAESQAVANELAAENERQATQIAELHQEVFELQTDKATQAGRLAQLDTDLWALREELAGERRLVEAVRIELAKAQTRLEHMARLEALLAEGGKRRIAV